MGKAEAGSTKAIANSIKAKGLGRLRWYCQICEKQCRDENGFQAHTRSEPHMRKMLLIGPKAGQTIAEFSNQFQKEFVALLKTRHQTVRVRANAVYNEYIQDKEHIHMNATRWVTLSGFVMTLGKAGIVKVDEDEKGLWITWVDNSPHTLAKQAASQKRDRAVMDGEERERAELQAQIERARAKEAEKEQVDANLQKKEGEKISLKLFDDKPPTTTTSSGAPEAGPSSSTPPTETAKSGITFGTIGVKPGAATTSISVNPLKRPAPVNVFKTAKVAKTDTSSSEASNGKRSFTSEAERLMKEDQARKAMRTGGGGGGGGGGYQGAGPKRTGDGGRRFVLQ